MQIDMQISRTSIFDSTDREFYITGIQMEVGSQATPFEHRSFGEELALCQRYYTEFGDGSSGGAILTAVSNDTSRRAFLTYPTQMRASPTVSVTFNGGLPLLVQEISILLMFMLL